MTTPRAGVEHRQPVAVDRELQRAVTDDTVVSFAGGVPADELFPTQEITDALTSSVHRDAASVLQYGWPAGVGLLRAQIASAMARRGISVPCERVLITSGAQQALSLLAQLLVPVGSPIAVEVPTYVSALHAFDLRKPTYRAVPRTAQGIELDALERALGVGQARLLYLVASGHNPTGGVLDRAQREAVLECAARHDAWVIDDDAYGELQFEEPEPPLLALGHPVERIIHVGSFSKVLAPGLRVGWIAGPAALIRELTQVKQAQDLETATLTQRVLSAWLDAHSLDDHLAHIQIVYRARRDALLQALSASLSGKATWDAPAAGFSLLLQLPPPWDATALLPRALSLGVGFEPAAPYFVDSSNVGAMRLSFSNVAPADIARGVERLARVL